MWLKLKEGDFKKQQNQEATKRLHCQKSVQKLRVEAVEISSSKVIERC